NPLNLKGTHSIPTYLAEGTRLQGEFYFQAACIIDSLLEGNITQQSLEPLRIGKLGWIQGSLSSQGPIVVEGRVEGTIFSQTEIKIRGSAHVEGTLIAPRIVIQPGAYFQGETRMQ